MTHYVELIGEVLRFVVNVILIHWVVKELLKLFPTMMQAVDRKHRVWLIAAWLSAIVLLMHQHK